MSAGQALQLLYLHQKEARLPRELRDASPRRGETTEVWRGRMIAISRAANMQAREEFLVAEALRHADGKPPFHGMEDLLPDLAQVTGWSKADPAKAPPEGERALFGGRRLGDWDWIRPVFAARQPRTADAAAGGGARAPCRYAVRSPLYQPCEMLSSVWPDRFSPACSATSPSDTTPASVSPSLT